jgi:hypothetical protein
MVNDPLKTKKSVYFRIVGMNKKFNSIAEVSNELTQYTSAKQKSIEIAIKSKIKNNVKTISLFGKTIEVYK